MITLQEAKYYYNGSFYDTSAEFGVDITADEAKKNTIAYGILTSHNKSDNDKKLNIKFDAMASHDITYVGIIQSARASGLEKFPIPYVLTNCHNSLCAVGGTINEDDHIYGLSAAKKYGGIFVPPHVAVIHQYMRESFAGCGKMILGSDSHTRYGALGCMAIGEGGPELVKQLLCRTYDIEMPKVIAINLHGNINHGVGPQDVALAIIGKVFKNGFVKNKVLEFVGDGISNLSVEFRNGIDVMTTETTCLSSVWITDEKVQAYLDWHGRANDYKKLQPNGVAYYDGVVDVDLSSIEPMIALPFHPSNTFTIREFKANAADILADLDKSTEEQFGHSMGLINNLKGKDYFVDQGVIAGCAGGIYDNIVAAAQILRGKATGSDFSLSVYPASQPVYNSLIRNGVITSLMASGASIRTAFCGPCFGAGDVPHNNGLSIRHTTRNFPNREGSKPGEKQLAGVALMDARSIAATAANKGILTSAAEVDYSEHIPQYNYDETVYTSRVYKGHSNPNSEQALVFGPNIADFPDMKPLAENLLLKVCAVIQDPVTTTDELIPSGETSSFRSNPLRLAQFTLSRKVPNYVPMTKNITDSEDFKKAISTARLLIGNGKEIGSGSIIFARKPGDGSAREQAASCQRFLGTMGNIALEYATKRYRSNLINWGMLPFISSTTDFVEGTYILIPDIKKNIQEKKENFPAFIITNGETKRITLSLPDLSDSEREIILDGSLINHYKK